MIGRIALIGAVILAAAATNASAQQTLTYAYDVHGRLLGVARTTGSTNQTTTYVLDKADNRTSRTTGASTTTLIAPEVEDAWPPLSDIFLNSESGLAETEAASSPNTSGGTS